MKTALDTRWEQKERELEHMTREVDRLVQERKDLRRFKEIDKEKAELASLQSAIAETRATAEAELTALRHETEQALETKMSACARLESALDQRDVALKEQERESRARDERSRESWTAQRAELETQRQAIAHATAALQRQREEVLTEIEGCREAIGKAIAALRA